MRSYIGPWFRIPGLIVGLLGLTVFILAPPPLLSGLIYFPFLGVMAGLSAWELWRHGLRPAPKSPADDPTP